MSPQRCSMHTPTKNSSLMYHFFSIRVIYIAVSLPWLWWCQVRTTSCIGHRSIGDGPRSPLSWPHYYRPSSTWGVTRLFVQRTKHRNNRSSPVCLHKRRSAHCNSPSITGEWGVSCARRCIVSVRKEVAHHALHHMCVNDWALWKVAAGAVYCIDGVTGVVAKRRRRSSVAIVVRVDANVVLM